MSKEKKKDKDKKQTTITEDQMDWFGKGYNAAIQDVIDILENKFAGSYLRNET